MFVEEHGGETPEYGKVKETGRQKFKTEENVLSKRFYR